MGSKDVGRGKKGRGPDELQKRDEWGKKGGGGRVRIRICSRF